MNKSLELIEAHQDYHVDLVNSIDAAEEQVLLETMNIDNVDRMHDVLEACRRARKRGAYVVMLYDIYSYPTIGLKYGPLALQRFNRHMKSLEEDGVDMVKVGGVEINPFAGRHHAKAVIADSMVYAGGGINLTDDSFDTRDYMFKFDDKSIADKLFKTLPELAQDRPEQAEIALDDQTNMLVDGGVKNKSIILDRAKDLANRAQSLHYVSKLAPDGELRDILAKKEVDYWYNSISSSGGFDKLAIMIDSPSVKDENLYKDSAMLHAKFLVGSMPDGTLEAIAGSHNFNSRGVEFGTQEIAFHTRDQAMCQRLLDFADSL